MSEKADHLSVTEVELKQLTENEVKIRYQKEPLDYNKIIIFLLKVTYCSMQLRQKLYYNSHNY